MFAKATMNRDRHSGRVSDQSFSDFDRRYQSQMSPRSRFEGANISAADVQPPQYLENSTRSVTALECSVSRQQRQLHQIEGAATSNLYQNPVPHRPHVREGSSQHPSALDYDGSVPVSPISPLTPGPPDIDDDPTTEDEDEMIITADEQDYDKESVNDGTPKTAEEIRAEKRKMKRFRYWEAGNVYMPLGLLLILDSLTIRLASFSPNLHVRLTRMHRSESGCREKFRASAPDKSKSGFKIGEIPNRHPRSLLKP